jgi:hypothetical protein
MGTGIFLQWGLDMHSIGEAGDLPVEAEDREGALAKTALPSSSARIHAISSLGTEVSTT